MTAPENFVSRWSRLKRGSAKDRETAPAESTPPLSAVAPAAPPTPSFDPATLPPIESITGDTDIRAFLQSGVPTKLAQAALRRLWATDPAIRDFIGIAENQWDFTNPTTIPGFGPLQETADKLSLVAQTVGTLDKSLDRFSGRLPDTRAPAENPTSPRDARRDEIEDTARETQAAAATRAVDSEMSDVAPENGRVEAAAKNNLSPGSTSLRRRPHAHGGALPR